MATTTNFGWETPDDTDLVKDGAAAIRTALGGVDTSFVDLKGGTTGQVLAKASGTDLDFSWVAQDDSNAIQNALLTTTGDTIYASSASTPARRAIGTTGQVLTVSGGVPVWATPSGGGKVLQVVYASTTTAVSVATAGTPATTGLSGTITPSATTSKILVMANQSFYNFGANRGWSGAIYRGATQVYYQDNGAGQGSSNINAETRGIVQIQYLDSPSTTSATTYEVRARTGSGSGVIYQGDSTPSNIILIEIGA